MANSSTEHLIPLHIKQAIDKEYSRLAHYRISEGDAEIVASSYILIMATIRNPIQDDITDENSRQIVAYAHKLVQRMVVKEKPRFVSKGSISALLAISFFAGVLVSSLFVTEMGKKILSHLGNF